ncbi:MAG: hypothetical protein DHS20C18_26960 [Saprospiraceae bacterium]|nr:MAG: hypothetical protein DHS20C18_26960 [Saprospiraceae bacterium]
MNKRILLLSLIVSFFSLDLSAQVPKKVVVEHFTNTRCSICASRNPSFYTNLNNHPNILHLSIHPSAPYSSCLLHQHNPTENDGRTNYYNVYGSTPRLVIQGEVIPTGDNYSNSVLFDPYEDRISPASITFSEVGLTENNSVRVTLSIKTEAAHNLTDLKLFVALAEDTIFYNAPNGEELQFDVFRKAMTAISGDDISLPASVGESVTFTATIPLNPEWVESRIFPVVILQESGNKAVVQSAAGPTATPVTTTAVGDMQFQDFDVYPNPVHDFLYFQSQNSISGKARMYTNTGKLIGNFDLATTSKIDLSHYAAGVYFLKLIQEGQEIVRKVVKL